MYVVSTIKLLNKGKANVVALMEEVRIWQIHHLKELMKNRIEFKSRKELDDYLKR
jgi:uncharacterized protein YfdQ (DUF2303 family)